MKLTQLIAEARRRMDDEVEPYFTTDQAHADAANEAEREACFRARLLYDGTVRPDITTITVFADQRTYPIDSRVFWIDSATFTRSSDNRSRDLCLRGLDWIREQPAWDRRFASRPEVLADDGRQRMTLWPTPASDGVLQLAVYRYPLASMALTDTDATPEIEEHHHEHLVNWMLYRAYTRPDADSEDRAKAADALGMFEATFGRRESAAVHRRHRERRRITTRYGGL